MVMRNGCKWAWFAVLATMLAASPSLADPSAENATDRCGAKVRLRGPIYDYATGALQPGIGAILDELAAKFVERCGEKLLIIEAHAAEMPTPELNQRLSELRAQTLRFELAKRGIPESQLLPVGMGSSKPVASAGEPDAMNLNRRVTFRVAD
jgi:outer membrane protein OmpA-like peptidoglycan-associated protein